MNSFFKTIIRSLFICFCLCNCSTPHSARSATKVRSIDIKEERFRLTVITLAREMVGKKYKCSGKGPAGFDCSGLVIHVLGEMNVTMPASSQEQAKYGKPIPLASAKPGDLIFFKNKTTVTHVGIITENKPKKLMVVHSTSSKGVIEENILKSDYWTKRISRAIDLHSFSKQQIRVYSSK